MDLDNYRIPRHLDAPPMFLMWEADTAGIFLICLMASFMVESFIPAVAGILLARGYARLKQDGSRGVLVHLLFWYTPSSTSINGKKRIHSHIREYIG